MGRNGREYDKENTIGQQYVHNYACLHRDKLHGKGIGSRLAFAVVDGFHRHRGCQRVYLALFLALYVVQRIIFCTE